MKRIFILSLVLCLVLCGCTQLYTEPEQTIIISAIGIDTLNGSLLLTVETVDTSTPDGGLEYSKKVFEAAGKNCESAFLRLQKSLGNKLSAEHCVLIVAGESAEKELLYDTLLYLRNTKNLSQNAKLVSVESANRLLKLKSKTGQAVGYDAVKILNMQESMGAVLKCNLYSVLSDLQNKEKLRLPAFEIQGDSYYFTGDINE